MSQCKHIFTKGPKTGQQCPKIPKKGDRCFQHKDCIDREPQSKASRNETAAQKMAVDPVFGDPNAAVAPTTADSGKKLSSSIWTWTLNSNKAFSGLSDMQKATFKELIESTFEPGSVEQYLIDQTADNSSENIKKLNSEHYFEIGTGRAEGQLHAHGIIELQHTGFYHLDVDAIRAVAKEVWGSAVHFNSRATSDPTIGWKAYQQKQQRKIDL